MALDILHDVLFKKGRSGVRISPFCGDLSLLTHALALHGLFLPELDVFGCRDALLSHLFQGACIHKENSSLSMILDRPSCDVFQSGFMCSRDLSVAAIDSVLAASVSEFPTEFLVYVTRCLGLTVNAGTNNVRHLLKRSLSVHKKNVEQTGALFEGRNEDLNLLLLKNVDNMRLPSLKATAKQHGLASNHDKETLKVNIFRHLSDGRCFGSSMEGCSQIIASSVVLNDGISPSSSVSLTTAVLTLIARKGSRRNVERVLKDRGIQFTQGCSLRQLRAVTKKYVTRLNKGKAVENIRMEATRKRTNSIKQIRDQWPQLVPQRLKDKIVDLFKEQTSSAALSVSTCASCAEDHLNSDIRFLQIDENIIGIFKRPDKRQNGRVDSTWLDQSCIPPDVPFSDGVLRDVLLDPRGVRIDPSGGMTMSLCADCNTAVKHSKLPALALANHTFLGSIPKELRDLTVVEEAMIARCRSKCWVVQLKEFEGGDPDLTTPSVQRGMRGHIIIYPQRPSEISSMLPPSIDDISTPICVIFVGSSPPSNEWLREKAKPLVVRREKVREALVWLKNHNSIYKDIVINHTLLNTLEPEQILPVRIEHVLPTDSHEILTSGYDPVRDSIPNPARSSDSANIKDSTVPFQNVVITDVDGDAPINELRAAAVRHIKSKSGGYIELPHDPQPVNEFCNPKLFPMIYPCLFPYGIGGSEDPRRCSKLALKRHVKHWFKLTDRRFQEHYSFLFTAFNILQRRAVLLHTSLKVKKKSFDSIAADFASVSPSAVHIVSERIARGDYETVNSDEERRVANLMKQVRLVTTHVPGSSSSRVAMRNEIRGLMIDRGMPSFYITINPADLFNPLVTFLAGSDINIDELAPADVPTYWDQSLLVARNPAVAAKFFNLYMKAFISAILGYDSKSVNVEGGILGVVKAYYGCVEAQGRGTLHCHMMVWVEGGLNPNEIKRRVLDEGSTDFKDRLLAFLDDTISNCVPDDPNSELSIPSSLNHPCSVRGVSSTLQGESRRKARQKDMHNLVKKCQLHRHGKTCYKYWKGGSDPKECRFGLDVSKFREESSVDDITGELCLRCLDGLVNNFNHTILEAVRCNMDINFIGSGASAKAILYYITDYITKSQLKTHVAFAALELAVSKLGEYDPLSDDVTIRSKRLLQKCAHAMISHQELSAPQVVSYLMDFEDHFTSHTFKNLFWTGFEKIIDEQDPSPLCYPPGRNSMVVEQTRDRGDCTVESPNDGLAIIGESGDVDTRSTNPCDDPRYSPRVTSVEAERSDDLDDISIRVDDETGEYVDETNEMEIGPTNEGTDMNVIMGVEPEELTDKGYTDLNDDEVGVAVNGLGELVAKLDQVADYQARGMLLENVCVWDFVSQVDKIHRSKRTSALSAESESESETDDDPSDTDDRVNDMTLKQRTLLTDESRKRPMVELNPSHGECASHVLRVRAPIRRFVPVPIGPSIPRRDKSELRERYSRLMLILFKPWRTARDLRQSQSSWTDAFDNYMLECPDKWKTVMDNMQILHECRDSRDDHFANRCNSRRDHSSKIAPELVQNNDVGGFEYDMEGEDEDAILKHFDSVMDAQSLYNLTRQDVVNDCLRYVDRNGLFPVSESVSNPVDARSSESHELAVDSILEELWRKTYEERRDRSKRRNAQEALVPDVITNAVPSIVPVATLLRDGSRFREAQSMTDAATCLPKVNQQMPTTDPDWFVDIDAMVQEFNLNTEQARAFRIITEHSFENNPEPLRMYLGGAGGTGKSTVIKALKSFFERRNQSRRFRLASYTGVAARNISGVTLHSALCLNQRKGGIIRGKTRRDLVAAWDGVDYLFIDEVSMIGCNLLLSISRSLADAKDKKIPFGGVNVIFAGDFAQLPPVGQTKLYAHINTAKVNTSSGQNAVFGKILWLSVNTVVMLTEVMRQSGEQNARFVDLLSRLRDGRCTKTDYDLLCSRLIDNVCPKWSEARWKNAPVIVPSNDVKDALNIRGTIAFAQQTGRQLHWYHAIDEVGGKPVSNLDLISRLKALHSGQTNSRLGCIPLVIGMPVMINSNFDVEAGIVNGCTGVLKSIRYRKGVNGERHAVSCVVNAPGSSGENLPGLQSNEVVALQDTVDLEFRYKHSGKKCKVKRTQIPVVPGFSMTAYKAQGQTLNDVIVDLTACSGTETPYVMLSRVKSLEGLLILRPFASKKIACRQSEDMRRESIRLKALHRLTVMKTGTAEESVIAQRLLTRTDFREYIGRHNIVGTTNYSAEEAVRALQQAQSENVRLTDSSSNIGSMTGRTKRHTTSDEVRGAKKRKLTPIEMERIL